MIDLLCGCWRAAAVARSKVSQALRLGLGAKSFSTRSLFVYASVVVATPDWLLQRAPLSLRLLALLQTVPRAPCTPEPAASAFHAMRI